jgi:hypothetical protein
MSKEMLCGKPGGCCPSIEEDESGYIIRDDFDGEVRLTKAELKLLLEKVK